MLLVSITNYKVLITHIEFDDISTMLNQLQENDSIDGALLESNQWTVYSTLISKDDSDLPRIGIVFTLMWYFELLNILYTWSIYFYSHINKYIYIYIYIYLYKCININIYIYINV